MNRDEIEAIAKELGFLPDASLLNFASRIESLVRDEAASIIEVQDVDPAFKLRMAAAIRKSEG